MTHLLDGNLLVALTIVGHVHHEEAGAWLEPRGAFATCPTVQGTLLRALLRQGASRGEAQEVLAGLLVDRRHEQWLDDLTYAEVDLSHVLGHRQVTDAYLAQLARVRGGRVATFDRGFAAAAPDVVDLVS